MTDAPIISARSVTRRFGGLVALDGIDLDVPRGIVQAIIGPNGSGKTTLLNALSGASHADAGSIRINGREIFRLKPNRIARMGLTRTFQTIRIFTNLTVLENVMVAASCNTPSSLFTIIASPARQRQNEAKLEHDARDALDIVGLGGRAADRASQLPYAQQRLLEIARALAAKPSVLLLDEPAAGMNMTESMTLLATIAKLKDSGLTILLVEHNVRLVMGISDRVAVLDFGRKIAEGSPADVQRNPLVVEAYLGSGIVMLKIEKLHVSYGHIEVLKGISFSVEMGEIVALIGGNGAGKTTTLSTISGLLRPTSGTISWKGETIHDTAVETIVGAGLAHCPEGRRIFPGLTVRENLITGTASRSYRKAEVEDDLALVFDLFPRLKERIKQGGWSLSGGEQQMLAIGRALMSRPSLLMLDEPSLGLAPIVIEQVFDKILELNKRTGLGVLLVEQNSAMALDIASRAFVLETGTITLSGPSAVLAGNPPIREAYLGG